MNMIVMAETVCELFTAIFLMVQFGEHDIEKSARLLKINSLVILLWLLVDVAAYCTNLSYIPTLLTFSLGSLSLMIFCCYCDVYIGRKATLKSWVFLLPKILSVISVIASLTAFFMGKVWFMKTATLWESTGILLLCSCCSILYCFMFWSLCF